MLSNSSIRIGIFGGSFNPPHLGHLHLVTELADRLKLEHVLIIPNKLSPYKSSADYASENDRLEMCRLNFSDSRFEVSTAEIDREGKSYTYDTLCTVRRQYPDAELYLIVGSDMLYYFDKWYRYKDILKMCTLCAAERDDVNEPIRNQGTPEYLKGHSVSVFADIKPLTISSTEIRDKLRHNESVEGLLRDEVYRYIVKGGIYHE